MRCFHTDDDAREARDLAVECMALLDATGVAVRTHASEAHWLVYRRAVAEVMMGPARAIRAAIAQVPALRPSHEDWHRITLARLTQAALDTIGEAADGAALTPHLPPIRARLDRLDGLYAVPRDPPIDEAEGWTELAALAAAAWGPAQG